MTETNVIPESEPTSLVSLPSATASPYSRSEARTTRPLDLTDQRYGRLLVCRKAANVGKSTAWTCRCDCGSEVVVVTNNLRRGTAKSCGCLRRDRCVARSTKHGKAGSSLYMIWAEMVARCSRPTHKRWGDYGGRGIGVCDTWKRSFEAFSIDMGLRPPGHSIERIDNTRGYEPGNCAWVTRVAQANNKRNNRLITHDGRTQTLAMWARETGIPYHTLKSRLQSMSVATALTRRIGRWC